MALTLNGSTGIVVADGATIGSTSDTDAITVPANGRITFNQAILAQAGIQPNANAYAATEVLDDYEEGSWTPTTPNAGSVTTGEGRYIRIGKMVTVFCYVATISNTTSSNGFDIGGLPFSASNPVDSLVGAVMTRYIDDNTTEPLGITSYISGGGNSMQFYITRGNGDSYGRVLHSYYGSANIGLRTTISYEAA